MVQVTFNRNTSADISQSSCYSYPANAVYISNSCYNECKTITSVDLQNIPWQNNSMYTGFYYCNNLQSVTNINSDVRLIGQAFQLCFNLVSVSALPQNITDMYRTFYGCSNLVIPPSIPNSVIYMYQTFGMTKLTTAPSIPNSVVDASGLFHGCESLQTGAVLPNSVTNASYIYWHCTNITNIPNLPNNITDLSGGFTLCNKLVTAPIIPASVSGSIYSTVYTGGLFQDCTNLTGNIYIYSNQITNAYNCFNGTSLTKNVYIPFKYANNVNTATYNSFIAAGYKTDGSVNGVYLKDLNELFAVDDANYTITNVANTIYLNKYIGSAVDVVVPWSKT